MCHLHEDVALQTISEELPIAGVGSYVRATEKVRYEISDHLGNTRASFTTDEEGDLLVIEAHDYYPHGGLLPGRQLNSSNGSPLAYQGQEYDEEVGLTAFNLRQYDARLGRWISPDPYGQHYSPYLGMSNNPVSFIDPDGGYDQLPYSNEEWRAYYLAGRDEFTQFANSVHSRNAEGERGVWDSWSNIGGGIDADGRSRDMDGMIHLAGKLHSLTEAAPKKWTIGTICGSDAICARTIHEA